ncbi:hypothetical protein GCM10029963_31120 [Micromonospora andamanensis]
MPASTRHHKALAAIVHCIGLLTALPVLPAATVPAAPTATVSAAPTATVAAAPTATAPADPAAGRLQPAAATPDPSMPAAPRRYRHRPGWPRRPPDRR